jgi:hypothetical protein
LNALEASLHANLALAPDHVAHLYFLYFLGRQINRDFDNSPCCLVLSHRAFIAPPHRLSLIALARYHGEGELGKILNCVC